MAVLNKDNFWAKKTYTLPSEVDYMYERLQKAKEFVTVQKVLGAAFAGAKADSSYFDVLKEKVITAQNMTISETQNRTRQLNSLVAQAQGKEGALQSDDDLSDEAIMIQEQINYQSQVKFLQMYFDAYMAPKVSDIEWRLGKVTGTVLATDVAGSQFNGGMLYTRSAFSFPFYRQYWEYDFIGGSLGFSSGVTTDISGMYSTFTNFDTNNLTDARIDEIVKKINDFNSNVEKSKEEVPAIFSGVDSYIANLNTSVSGILNNKSLVNSSGLIDPSNKGIFDNYISGINYNLKNISTTINNNFDDPDLAKKSYHLQGIKQKKEYYSTMFFPPYKISSNNEIGEYTQLMNDIYSHNPNAQFDVDSFLLRKEGFTYRDPGFKSITDYINYLQWVIEGATGVVHTYLTEWDLSLYMQENMMTATVNGAPLKLYLNYRIRKDNPLSSNEVLDVSTSSDTNASSSMNIPGLNEGVSTGKYTDDRALVFNVAGSAVSKIDMDNNKLWRPSDFPLSVWWMPYLRGRDWEMSVHHIEDYLMSKDIPYMDIYDTVNSKFPYDNAELKDIFKNQDFLGAIMGNWSNWNMKYYHAFYSTPLDGHSDWDIKSYGDLQKVAGADFGVATKKKKAIEDFVKASKEEMLLNEGYYGAAQTIAGFRNRDSWINDGSSNSESDEKTSMSKMMSKRDSKAKEQLSDVDLDQPFASGEGKAQDMLSTGLNNKVDASSMTNFTGINRFSPALFGGPHGSDYNPNTIQAYFDVNSQLLRNVPRIDPTQAKDDAGVSFNSENNDDFYEGLNSLYDNGTKTGLSPAKALSHLIKGITAYTINYGYMEVERKGAWVPVKDVNNPPVKNKQGYAYSWYIENDQRLVNYSDKRIVRTFIKTIRYTGNPWSQNDLLTGKVLSAQYNGKEYIAKVQVTEKRANYKEMALVPFKEYLIFNKPNVKWEIVQHKFEKYTASLDPSADYWNNVSDVLSKYRDDSSYDYRTGLNNLSKKYKPIFILKFWQDQSNAKDNEKNPEKDIRENLVLKGKGDKTVSVFFLQGNDNARSNTGPQCIFKASLSLGSYVDVQDNYVERQLWPFPPKKTKTGESYRPHSFIIVDIPNSEIISDDLQYKGYSNIKETGIRTPMHLNSPIKAERENYLHIMQKFKKTNSVNAIRSFRTKKTTKQNMWLAVGLAIAAVLTGGLILAVAAVVVAAKQAADAKKDKEFDDFDGSDKPIRWQSASYQRLSGVGLMSQIQGTNPSASNVTVKNTTLDFKDKLTISGNPGGTSFNSISISEVDSGLQKALLNIYLRPKFLIQKEKNVQWYDYVPLDTPIRNFLSVLLTQLSYFKFVKSSIIGETATEGLVDFNILYKTLTMCVDKCVLKASGMNALNERIQPDREHIYYDYWIDQIIKILHGSDEERLERKNLIRSELNERISIFESVIEVLHPICLKNIEDWTLDEIITSLNLMDTVKTLLPRGNLENFLFGYLRILYYYRFFFIAKRFNKENGTMWIMRALESVLEFIVPTIPPSGPPPSPSEMMKKEPIYNVSFYELQNTTEAKRQAIIQGTRLEADRITKVYIRVQWVERADYDRWISYKNGETTTEYDEIIVLTTPKGIEKYALKPIDGFYTLISKEYLENDKNIKWNNIHPLEIQRDINDFDTAQWMITWEDSPNMTPIRWNIFGEIDINNLLQYAKESISPEELVCLMEEGADFWTVSIPESKWPRSEGFKTKIKIKQYAPINPEQLSNDPMVNLLGPSAYSVYPITQNQERPFPGVASDNPTMFKLANDGLGGY